MIRIRSAGICALMVVMGIWIGVNKRMIASARAMMPEIEAQQRQVDIHIARTKQLIDDRATLDARRGFLEQLQQRISLVPVLADISDRMPESVLLTRLSLNAEYLEADEPANSDAPTAADLRSSKPNKPLDVTRKISTSDLAELAVIPPVISIRGVARAVPDILEFAAALERSKLLGRIEMQIRRPGIWAGKQVQRFEVTGALVPQKRSLK